MRNKKKKIIFSVYTRITPKITAKLALFILLTLLAPSNNYCKKAIIIGATSGMGRATAKYIAQDGYDVGLVGRRAELLESLAQEIHNNKTINNAFVRTYTKVIDLSDHAHAPAHLQELIAHMGGLDLILISVSCYSKLDQEPNKTAMEQKIIDVDLIGFWQMARTALDYFETQKSGHLAAISSMSGLRGSAHCPAYCGAKAFISRYLEGVRNKFLQQHIPIYVTDIIPGWVDVEHTTFSQIPGTYWVTPLDKAAQQIYDAIKKKKKVAYISKRQIIIALLLAITPDCIFNGIGEF